MDTQLVVFQYTFQAVDPVLRMRASFPLRVSANLFGKSCTFGPVTILPTDFCNFRYGACARCLEDVSMLSFHSLSAARDVVCG